MLPGFFALNGDAVVVQGVNLLDEIFEYVPNNGNDRIFFNATKLATYAEAHGEPIITSLDGIAQHILVNGGIEENRVERLCEPYLSRPATAVLMPDDTTLIVDGNHRIVRLWRDGKTVFKLYRVKFEECKPYILSGGKEL